MSTEEATYLIAHEAGLQIDRHLSHDEVVRIRALHHAGKASAPNIKREERPRSKNGTTATRELRLAGDFRISNPLLEPAKLGEASAMARVYPLLYVLENSIRELIKRVMRAKFGEDWWNTEPNKGKLKNVHQTADTRMRTERKDSWHQKRGSHPIDYVDIGDLETIITGKQECFVPDIIPDLRWFEQFMKELYPSRNVVAHMNPLDDHNVRDVQLKLKKWENTLKSASSAIPA